MANNGSYRGFDNNKETLEQAIDSSSGVSDASKIIKTNSDGVIDLSMLPVVGFTNYAIQSGEEVFIPEFQSAIISGPLENYGTLENEGRFEVI